MAGCTTASSTPASIGMPRSSSEPNPHSAELAEPIRSRPTIAGSAPNAAPSKNTYAVWARKPATSACTAVSDPIQNAMGTEATVSPATTSATTMTRCRWSRSDSAPENRPKSR